MVSSDTSQMSLSEAWFLDLASRQRVVEVQVAGRGVRDQRVLDAMKAVPREVFVHSGLIEVRLAGMGAHLARSGLPASFR